MRLAIRLIVAVACVATVGLFVDSTPARAQGSPTGTLSGSVIDSSGAVLPGVTVIATGAKTGLTQQTISGGAGDWRIPGLPLGVYDVSFELDGFKKLVRSGVTVEASTIRSVPVTLEVGGLTETVQVTGDAALLNITTSATARSLTNAELESVPTSTGSFTHLLSSEAGVSADLPPVLVNGTGNISPSVNGTRTTSTSLFFNGIDATNLTTNEGAMSDNISPAADTLEEVKLQTSMYDASTGRSGGGNFQLVTRSGTNTLRGTAGFTFQHEGMNANDFFYEKDGIDKPKARRDEGGFTVGGPIRQNRFFFFGGYQRTQAETGFVPTASSISVLPQALQLIQGARTKENLLNAFAALNPNILQSIPKAQCSSPTDTACISDVALNLLNLRNPVTGDYVLPAPRAGATMVGNDINAGSAPFVSVGGNPFVRQRNVVPAEFTQDQFTAKLDGELATNNRLSVTGFYAKFPGLDPFPDPSSLASPFTLKRDDYNATVAVSDNQIWGASHVNEMRGGIFFLNNSRQLDDPFLAMTNDSVGVPNPANFFDASAATTRLGHYVGRPGGTMERFSFGGPNDTFNKRQQRTYTIGDTLSLTTASHALRMGGEFRHNQYNTNLPEEQATEFEKFDNFTMFLRGLGTEGDTQFGITDKQFRFNDFNMFVADDWRISRTVTINLGMRYEFFGLPTEVNGRIGNVDFDAITDLSNPVNAFIVPNNVQNTGFAAVDAAIAASRRVDNKHTLNGQDWNNVAPRIGFAWTPTEQWVVRGGYGIFYDRPSAAFMNTVFSNYPFLREQEVTFPGAAVPFNSAWSQQDPTYPFNQYLPNQIVRTGGAAGTYQIRDGTNVIRGADGTLNPINPATGLPFRGNIAETFEFRAVDRDLHAAYVQQYNFGVQRSIGANMMVEVRYVGSKGSDLLEALAFNQGYDLNDPSTPDHIFERFNQAYVAANSPNGPLNAGATARERGVGRAFGFPNSTLGGMLDYNLANAGGSVIGFEARTPILGFNVPEALLLGNTGRSLYNSVQFGFTKRMSDGLQFNLAYTYSRSMDTSSADPGSTAGGGKPDTPNAGFVVQGDNRDVDANWALSDFDRPHRFSGSWIWNMGAGFRFSGFVQLQSGLPYSIYSVEPEIGSVAQYTDLVRGSGGLYRLGFGRPSLCESLDDLRQQGSDPTEAAFNKSVLCSPTTAAGGYPDNLGYGNLGRNELRGFWQRRVDLSLAKAFALGGARNIELRWDIFNVFNTVNYALPNNVIGAATTDFGKITDSVGGPRVMQVGARFRF
ncbi:MAG TPA: carboxypeptidase-like regulatory domain-containing protein [Vicinamibacterales bacterium]|nr:carboxypeptidase-like regulatory domain-containing protein [Vicinamibacterales bacterium]